MWTFAVTRLRMLKPRLPDRSTPIPRPHAEAEVDVTVEFGPTIKDIVTADVGVNPVSALITAVGRPSPASTWLTVSGSETMTLLPYGAIVTPAIVIVPSSGMP